MPRRLYLLLLQTSRNTFLGLFSSSGYTPCTRLLLKITRVAHSSLASHPWCTGRSYRKPNVPLYYFRPSPTYKRSIPISFRRNNADLSFPKVMCTLFEVIVGLEARALTLRKFKVVLASWLVGTEQEHHRLLLKAEARERENKMKDSLLPLGAMKDPRCFPWISGKKIMSFFPSKNHSSRAFLDLLDPKTIAFYISHFTFICNSTWVRSLESFNPWLTHFRFKHYFTMSSDYQELPLTAFRLDIW